MRSIIDQPKIFTCNIARNLLKGVKPFRVFVMLRKVPSCYPVLSGDNQVIVSQFWRTKKEREKERVQVNPDNRIKIF